MNARLLAALGATGLALVAGCATADNDRFPVGGDALIGVDTIAVDARSDTPVDVRDAVDDASASDATDATDATDDGLADGALDVLADAETDADTYGELDGDTGDDTVADVISTTAAVTFPKTGDAVFIKSAPYVWHAADRVEGTRTTTLPSATRLVGSWNFVNELESSPCGYPFPIYGGGIKFDVFVNDIKVGTLSLSRSTGSSVAVNLTFPIITGPSYKLRYQAVKDVDAACGQIQFIMDTSNLTLS